MAQWLIEEAVRLSGRTRDPEEREADELLSRHAELRALSDRMRVG